MPENRTYKIEKNGKTIDVAERILDLNNKIQSGQGLKKILKHKTNA